MFKNYFENIVFVLGIICTLILSYFTIVEISNPPKVENTYYAVSAVVVEIRPDYDDVVAIDFNGKKYYIDGIEDWMIGDIATMVLNNKGTVEVKDDVMISCHYDGYITGDWGWDGEKPIMTIEP